MAPDENEEGATPTGEEERGVEPSLLGYVLFYGGIIGLLVALGVVMVLLMRFGR